MPEAAFATDGGRGEFLCLVVLLGCIVAVGAAMWLDMPPETPEQYEQPGEKEEDIGPISENVLAEAMRADALLVESESSKRSLEFVREEGEKGRDSSRNASPRVMSKKKED